MKRVKLVKLVDNKFKGEHPNGINTGHEVVGQELAPIAIGKAYVVLAGLIGSLRTSAVQSLPDEQGIFTTLNSTYKLIDLDEQAKR